MSIKRKQLIELAHKRLSLCETKEELQEAWFTLPALWTAAKYVGQAILSGVGLYGAERAYNYLTSDDTNPNSSLDTRYDVNKKNNKSSDDKSSDDKSSSAPETKSSIDLFKNQSDAEATDSLNTRYK